MQFPESWLREFCNPPITTQALADMLTMAGLEVEELRAVAPPFSKVLVGQICEVAPHPNAERLRVCQVDVGEFGGKPGEHRLLNIVCGAPNARAGIKVPCAVVGAVLPPVNGKPLEIGLGNLRGVSSEGMLCSSKELGINEEQGGLLELDQDAVIGEDIRTHLSLDDTIFTLKLTPNLAHCLSVYGVARELSALSGSPLKPLPSSAEFKNTSALASKSGSDFVDVDIQANDLCGRFSGRVLKGLSIHGPTPRWIVQRLERCGQRSVSPLVDISNYVMFECGQPTHIFDRDKIEGGLLVRFAKEGETLKLLSGNTVTLSQDVGVIADKNGVESLAGIMGGDSSAVGDQTKNIYVEAAFWWPQKIAGRSRRFNFSTEAGHRFERGVDPELTLYAVNRITDLVLSVCSTQDCEIGQIFDVCPNIPKRMPVKLRVARAVKVIGMPISKDQMSEALSRLGLGVQELEGGKVLEVTPPSYRFDIQIEEDLIEEVARVIGFDHLPSTPPIAPVTPRLRPELERAPYALRRQVALLGYTETINFSFVKEEWERDLVGNKDPIKLLNPIAAPMSVMRSSLLGSILEVLKFNLDRKATRIHIFEVGRVFKKDPSVEDSNKDVAGINQPLRLAGLLYGPRSPLQWGTDERICDFFDAKADIEALFASIDLEFIPLLDINVQGNKSDAVLKAGQPQDLSALVAQNYPYKAFHPGRSAWVMKSQQVIGLVGELHPRHRQTWSLPLAPILFELDWDALIEGALPKVRAISKFQTVERDVAVVVQEGVSHQDLMQAIYSSEHQGLICGATLFDIYRPKSAQLSEPEAPPAGTISVGQKSLAVRLFLSSDQATLEEVQIESTINSVLKSLEERLGAKLRT
jgi:phenylalanyl-tRNA synthetase beta chain